MIVWKHPPSLEKRIGQPDWTQRDNEQKPILEN